MFGRLGPSSLEDDLVSRYVDPMTGLPVGGSGEEVPYDSLVGRSKRVLKGMAKGLERTIKTPGAYMAANPYEPGSELATAYDIMRQDAGQDLANTVAPRFAASRLPALARLPVNTGTSVRHSVLGQPEPGRDASKPGEAIPVPPEERPPSEAPSVARVPPGRPFGSLRAPPDYVETRMPFGVAMPQEVTSSVAPETVAETAAGFVPGSGIADVLGYLPDFKGGTYPSFGQNVKKGEYGQAGLQTLNLAGDLLTGMAATAPLGTLAKGAAAARRAAKAAKAAKEEARFGTLATGEPAPPPIGHNMPPPEGSPSLQEVLNPPPPPNADRSQFFDVRGNPIPSAAYTKEARRILDEINAGPKGAGPIDLTKSPRSEVPQTFLPRYDPPQGISSRLQAALNNPDVYDELEAGIKRGMEMGAHKWYETDAIRGAFISELGPKKGEAEFKRYMDNVAATSPRSDVPTNVRNASYYYSHDKPADLPEDLPYPYGHVAQNLHRQNFEAITSEGGWDPLRNPKPASFSENLRGNYEPVTADTHAFRAIGMRTGDPRFLETSVSAKYKMGSDPGKDTIVNKYGERKGDTVTFRPQKLFADGKLTMEEAKKIPYFWAAKPNANEYAAVEELYRHFGDKLGITPAAAQAAGWAGSGELTGLGTVADKTFAELMNERILFTAKMRGEDPKLTLKNFIRRKKPLLSTAAVGLGLGAAAGAGEERQ